jgi:hypothetical protein
MAQAYGASIKAVFYTVKDIVNKEQNGFLSVDAFNNFASIAQKNIFNRMFNDIKNSKKLSRSGIMGSRDKARIKQIEEDLSFFSKSATLSKINNNTLASHLKFEKPSDLSRLISITTDGSILLDQSTKKMVDICYDEEKLERILLSSVSKPKEDAPLALISEYIEVFPTTINKIKVRYYKTPAGRSSTSGARVTSQPTFNTTAVGTDEWYEDGNTGHIDFELPETYTNDLILEICRMIGINLRDAQLDAYTSTEMSNQNVEDNG